VWFIGVMPAAADTWTFLKTNVDFFKPDPDEMD
jgi:hypothetical protein